MSTSQSFSPDDSLRLIRNMIDKTRQDVSDNSIYFLVWGWGAFLGCLGQFLLKVVFHNPYHYLVWLITFVCAAISVAIGNRQRKNERVHTYIGESMSYVWSGLGITFFVISIIFFKIGWQYCFPFFTLLYGLGTFVSGRFLKYKPLIVGGSLSFILAAVSAWMKYDYQILFAAGALLVSYIIPGHMLRNRYKSRRTH
jgi:hypothetical protein